MEETKDTGKFNLEHLNGDARKFVEGLIKWELITNQDQIMVLCDIMKEAKSQANRRSYVMRQTVARIGTQVDIVNYALSFKTASGHALVELF